MNTLFLSDGYGFYIVCSYAAVILFLFAAWYSPWRNRKQQALKRRYDDGIN